MSSIYQPLIRGGHRTAASVTSDPPPALDADGSAGVVAHGAADVVYADAAITAAFLRTLNSAPLDIDVDQSQPDRLVNQLRQMLLLLADEPQIALVSLQAMLAPGSAVRTTRRHIGGEVDRRLRAALGSGAWPEMVDLFEFALYGAVLQATVDAVPFCESADRLASLVDLLLRDGVTETIDASRNSISHESHWRPTVCGAAMSFAESASRGGT